MNLSELTQEQKVFGVFAAIVIVYALYVRAKRNAEPPPEVEQIVIKQGGDGTSAQAIQELNAQNQQTQGAIVNLAKAFANAVGSIQQSILALGTTVDADAKYRELGLASAAVCKSLECYNRNYAVDPTMGWLRDNDGDKVGQAVRAAYGSCEITPNSGNYDLVCVGKLIWQRRGGK